MQEMTVSDHTRERGDTTITKLLILESQPSDAEPYERHIEDALGPCEFLRVEMLDAYLTALQKFRPTLIISECKGPHFDGESALRLAKEHLPGVPFIVVTTTEHESIAVDLMKAGARDYLLKGHLMRLGLAAHAALEERRLRTERLCAEEALRRTLDFLDEAQRVAHFGSWEWDIASGGLTWSEEVYRLLGLEPGAVAPSHTLFLSVLAPEDSARVSEAIELALAGKQHYCLDFRMVRPDGSKRWVHSLGAVICDARAQAIRMTGVVLDVDHRKRVEEALRQSEAKLLDVFESLLDGVLVIDPTGKTLMVSPSMCRMLGYSEEEISRLNMKDISAGDWEEMKAIIERKFEGGPPLTSNVPIKRKDGSIFYADINAKPATYLGEPALVSCVRDVTERRNLQVSLAQADRLASMGMLAAGIAHEINNPLSYILYNLESIAESLPETLPCPNQPRARHEAGAAESSNAGQAIDEGTILTREDASARLRDALEGARRIKEISRGLGTFSRVETQDLLPVDLQSAMEHAIAIASNEIRFRARLVKSYARVPAVRATEGKLAQVFLNLLINAAHAIREGAVGSNQIAVRTWAEGDRVFAEVRDTGSGIAPEHRESIFEPFFTTKGIGVGSGLGLSICKNLLQGLGGDISFETEVGIGTRFVVELPTSQSAEAPPLATRLSAAKPVRRGRILAVDDDVGVQKMMRRLLTNHDVVVAGSGREAQAILECDQRFDVLLFDVMMSDVSGMDLFEWLVERLPTLARRVVFVTGGAFTARTRDFLVSVQNPQIAKPFDSAEFKRMINGLVEAAS